MAARATSDATRRTGDEELAVGADLEALDAGGARDADGARGGRDLRVIVRLPPAQPLAHVPVSAFYGRRLDVWLRLG